MDFIKDMTKQQIIDKILELKLEPQTEDVKLHIQRLQQGYQKIEEKMIEEVLYESHSKGKYREVMDRTHDIMGSEDFNDRRIDAYTQAYREIVGDKY